MTTIVIPYGVTKIAKCTFDSCIKLSSVVLPKGLSEIDNEAFNHCTGLVSVVLQEGLVRIGSKAFNYCFELSNITIPDSVPVDGLPSDAFSNCTLLEELSSAKSMSVERFLRWSQWRSCGPPRRYSVLASLLRLRTDLYAMPMVREVVAAGAATTDEDRAAAVAAVAAADEDGVVRARELRGVLAFDAITSVDVWRCILEFL